MSDCVPLRKYWLQCKMQAKCCSTGTQSGGVQLMHTCVQCPFLRSTLPVMCVRVARMKCPSIPTSSATGPGKGAQCEECALLAARGCSSPRSLCVAAMRAVQREEGPLEHSPLAGTGNFHTEPGKMPLFIKCHSLTATAPTAPTRHAACTFVEPSGQLHSGSGQMQNCF